MPLGHWNVQWLNQNSQRAYPLTEAATKRDKTDTIGLPTSFIVALYFPVHAGLNVEPQKFFIKELGVFPTGYNVALGYDDGTADPPTVGSVNIATSTHTENRSYAVAGVDDFDDSVGKIVIGSLDEISSVPPGLYEFTASGGALETDAIRPMLRGISSITVVSSVGDRSDPLYGHVELVAGNNMRITASQVGGQDPKITFSAIEGEGLNEECICEEESEGPCIRTINGIPPLPDGNFRLIGDDCINITPIDNGLKLEDTCSEPCCGCEELQAIEGQIDRFADGVFTLQSFINRLGAEVAQFHTVVLGSRLGDQGCVEC